tara:strand:+ start:1115 stop:1375 length:261 start_codon:yes stop_codon:yes gene_type:complete
MKHPCHKEQIPNLKRIEGQIRGITKMIDDDKYCIDILNQVKAVKSAITSVEGKILKTHLKECVKDALKNEKEFDVKVEEILKTLKR